MTQDFLNKSDVVYNLSVETGYTQATCENVLNAFMLVVENALAQDIGIRLVRFGTFDNLERKARIARNPSTGKEVQLPAKLLPRFRFSPYMKDRIAIELEND